MKITMVDGLFVNQWLMGKLLVFTSTQPGKLTVSELENGVEIVDLPMKHGDFP